MNSHLIRLLDPGDIEPEKASKPFTAPLIAKIDKRRGQKFCVLYSPWERSARIESLHTTARAALRAAAKARRAFKRANPGGYGHTWDACEFVSKTK